MAFIATHPSFLEGD
ncbi:hypothetical protein ID866_13183 [Astraeus odoratus]|nr:hypothetical protein ID866_13183 [Astraeus odoratus]